METRQVFGVSMEQRRNDRPVTRDDFSNIVTQSRDLPETAVRDLFIAWITLKFTQSNSVCYVLDGQTIGVGAGQQSRVHCTRLAGAKADLWRLRQHPSVLALPFRDGIKRPDRDNAIDQFLQPDVTEAEKKNWNNVFTHLPDQLTGGGAPCLAGWPHRCCARLGRFFPVPGQHRPRCQERREICTSAGWFQP